MSNTLPPIRNVRKPGIGALKKAAGIAEEIYGDTLATLEHARAQVNVQFLAGMEQAEKRDAARFDRRETAQRDMERPTF